MPCDQGKMQNPPKKQQAGKTERVQPWEQTLESYSYWHRTSIHHLLIYLSIDSFMHLSILSYLGPGLVGSMLSKLNVFWEADGRSQSRWDHFLLSVIAQGIQPYIRHGTCTETPQEPPEPPHLAQCEGARVPSGCLPS